jgi:hypothetical protein
VVEPPTGNGSLKLQVERELLNEDFSRNLLSWKHSGFTHGCMGEQAAKRRTSPKCGAEMKVITVIEDPDELGRILRHLVKTGRSPPGFDPDRRG